MEGDLTLRLSNPCCLLGDSSHRLQATKVRVNFVLDLSPSTCISKMPTPLDVVPQHRRYAWAVFLLLSTGFVVLSVLLVLEVISDWWHAMTRARNVMLCTTCLVIASTEVAKLCKLIVFGF